LPKCSPRPDYLCATPLCLMAPVLMAEVGDALGLWSILSAALSLAACVALLARRRRSKSVAEAAAAAATEAAAAAVASGADRWAAYSDPLRWACLPKGCPHPGNQERAEDHESDLCSVKILPIHRPTHEPWREQTGQYPFAWHMEGRKRLWEIRVQLRFKQVPTSKMYFGINLGEYVPVSGFSKRLQGTLVRACRSVVGDLYHSVGDDPKRVQGEVEPPTFVMPMWAFDQFIVSEPGDEPHLWGSLEGLGMRRTDGINAYIKAIRSTIDSFSTDRVYTFSFWGVSQFLDCMKWEICGGFLPGIRVDFNKLCGSPPVYVAMYEMPGVRETDADRRHLPSRKKYYFHVAMWSKLRPPKPALLEPLLGKREGTERSPKGAHRRRSLSSGLGLLSCFACGGDVMSQKMDMPLSPDERAMGG